MTSFDLIVSGFAHVKKKLVFLYQIIGINFGRDKNGDIIHENIRRENAQFSLTITLLAVIDAPRKTNSMGNTKSHAAHHDADLKCLPLGRVIFDG